MNKIIFLNAFLFILTILGCRKGPEDPSISLRSRNSRLIGTWELKSFERDFLEDTTSTDTVRYGIEVHEIFDGATINMVVDSLSRIDTLTRADSLAHRKQKKITKKAAYNFYQSVEIIDNGTYTLRYKKSNVKTPALQQNYAETNPWRWISATRNKDGVKLDREYQLVKLNNKEMQLSSTENVKIRNYSWSLKTFYTYKKLK